MPFVYHISKVKDGRSYLTRFVSVTQEGDSEVIFTCACSFKKIEANVLDMQDRVDLWKQYRAALGNKKPEDFEDVPGMDVPFYLKIIRETGHNDQFPGLESRKVDMEPYNKDKNPLDKRDLMFYRTVGNIPPNPNLHLCAHLYGSDRNSLYIVCNHLDVGDLYTQMGTLVHTVVFHSSAEDLMFGPAKSSNNPMNGGGDSGRWFCREDWTTRVASGRAMFHSRIWSSDGMHVATVMQDGMTRYSKKPEPTREEQALLDDRKKNWRPRQKL